MRPASGFFANVDDVLLSRARRGDLAALEQLYVLFSRPVFTLGCRLSGSREGGEEILQESFLEVVRSIGSFRGEGAFGAWLRRIVVSKSLMKHRRGHVRRFEKTQIVEGSATEPSQTPARSWDFRCDLERALAELPETARTVVWLHDVEGMTHREIGQIFNRTVSFSKSQLARAHAQLRDWLENEGSARHARKHRRAAGAAGR